MKLIKISKLASSEDFEIFPGVWFKRDSKWKIQYRQSEHILLDFDYELEDGIYLSQFPDLVILHKSLSYAVMPSLVSQVDQKLSDNQIVKLYDEEYYHSIFLS